MRGALMFIATTLLYPCALAALCLGTGLLVDRCRGRSALPVALLIPVGAAGLIAVSQLSTYVYVLAPATPYLLAVVGISGMALARARVIYFAKRLRSEPWLPIVSTLAYLLALAPVLLAGRTTFSSYMTLADSAVHLIGADFLIHHGQHYVHLDLRNSYGQFINDYYNTSYPSGADTLFGGSALLLGLPLIWALQPFNAFMLAAAVGPAWMLARRIGLSGAWAALAALTMTIPALVYAYELFASIKEIVALPTILALGALIATHRSWLQQGAARAIPFALLLAAGISSLGVGFGAWALLSVAVPGVLLAAELLARGERRLRALSLLAGAGVVLLIAAWPTWIDLRGALNVAQDIATTANPGNLHSPLRAIQTFGVWLGGSYKLAPAGSALDATHALIALTALACLLGLVQLLRKRAYALAAWIVLMLLSWAIVSLSASTWAAAKTLMLTSPVVILLAWGGVAAIKTLLPRTLALPLALLFAVAISGGVLVSDALQYHVSNLAPTARFEELASLDSRFAGQGPTLFSDFDEYSMYLLRDLDVGGPDFVYPPPTLANAAGGYGDPVRLDSLAPAALEAYPLIVTRRDPLQSRPPAAYRLVWQGAYYQVWRRRTGASSATVHRSLSGGLASQCRQIGAVAALAAHHSTVAGAGGRPDALVAAGAPTIVRIGLHRARHPRRWGHERRGLVMNRPGTLTAVFRLPSGGGWDVWVQGQLMPSISLSVDGRRLASISGQLSGNSLVPNTVPPLPVQLGGGVHRLSVTRGGTTLAPGEGGAAVLDAIFLTPAASPSAGRLERSRASAWRSLCGRSHEWVELGSS